MTKNYGNYVTLYAKYLSSLRLGSCQPHPRVALAKTIARLPWAVII